MRLSKMIGAVLVSTLLCAAPVAAQPAPPVDDQLRATARALADEGMVFFEQRKYAEALDRFERASTIIQAPTITLHQARALDKLGRLIEAAERYRACANTQLDANAPDAFRAAQDAARTELQALTPRIPSIEISVIGPGSEQAVVMLDGKPVLKALIGVKMLVNPGEHKITAKTETHSSSQDVSVAEKQVAPVVLTLVPITGDDSSGQSTVPDKPTKSTPLNGKKIAAYSALGVGGAFAIVGIAAGAAALGSQGKLEKQCPANVDTSGGNCVLNVDTEFTNLFDTFTFQKNLSIAGFVIGGVGIATGVTLLVLSKPKSNAQQPNASTYLTVQPVVGIGSLGLRGTF